MASPAALLQLHHPITGPSKPPCISCAFLISHPFPKKGFPAWKNHHHLTALGSCGLQMFWWKAGTRLGAASLPSWSRSQKLRVLLVLTAVAPSSNLAKMLLEAPRGLGLAERGKETRCSWGVPWPQAVKRSPPTKERGRCAGGRVRR